jgi:hypothetical protein
MQNNQIVHRLAGDHMGNSDSGIAQSPRFENQFRAVADARLQT